MAQGIKADLARAIVAIEIPVDPTVPSKIRDPECGFSSPSRSASCITVHEDGFESGYDDKHNDNLLLKATRSLTLPPGLRNWPTIFRRSR
jgi:hypothetical protein